jgi:hypothetical protein
MNITRMIAIPVLSAGILGSALGLASTASADVATSSSTGSHSIVAASSHKAPSVTDMSKKERKRVNRGGVLRDR